MIEALVPPRRPRSGRTTALVIAGEIRRLRGATKRAGAASLEITAGVAGGGRYTTFRWSEGGVVWPSGAG